MTSTTERRDIVVGIDPVTNWHMALAWAADESHLRCPSAADAVMARSPHGDGDHRAVGAVEQPVDDGADAHPGVPAPAPAADDDGQCVCGGVRERLDGRTDAHLGCEPDVGVFPRPAGGGLREQAAFGGEQRLTAVQGEDGGCQTATARRAQRRRSASSKDQARAAREDSLPSTPTTR